MDEMRCKEGDSRGVEKGAEGLMFSQSKGRFSIHSLAFSNTFVKQTANVTISGSQ
jgi:hypothetical protein